MLRYQKEQLANRDFQLVHLLVPLLWPGAVLAGKISGAIVPRREEGDGDLGAKLPENIFDHALFSLRNRLF